MHIWQFETQYMSFLPFIQCTFGIYSVHNLFQQLKHQHTNWRKFLIGEKCESNPARGSQAICVNSPLPFHLEWKNLNACAIIMHIQEPQWYTDDWFCDSGCLHRTTSSYFLFLYSWVKNSFVSWFSGATLWL